MSSELLTGALLAPEDRPVDDESASVLRVRLQNELRAVVTWVLRGWSGDPTAKLHYSVKRFARIIVIRYGLVLVGWPARIPYKNFNNVQGGNKTLLELLALWRQKDGGMRFERATAGDIANAKRDPKSVYPGYYCPLDDSGPASRDASPASTSSAPELPVVVPALVLHPDGSSVVGIHPTCTRPSQLAAALGGGGRPRKQRSDTKQPRFRSTGRHSRPYLLPKEGVKSAPFVLESGTEDTRTEPTSEPEPRREKCWLVYDPLHEIVPLST